MSWYIYTTKGKFYFDVKGEDDIVTFDMKQYEEIVCKAISPLFQPSDFCMDEDLVAKAMNLLNIEDDFLLINCRDDHYKPYQFAMLLMFEKIILRVNFKMSYCIHTTEGTFHLLC